MDRYGRLFIRASLVYLGLGAFFAIHMAFADHGMAQIRFLHVHAMLAGFMAMMIFGVAYHILPRFNAKAIRFPAFIPAHFWLANIGLVGMAGLYAAGAYYGGGAPRMLFGVFGSMQALGMFMFIANIWGVLGDDRVPTLVNNSTPATDVKPETPKPEPAKPEVKLRPSMKIAEILDQYPQLEQALVEEGLGDLANPAVRQSAARMVTLEMAARKNGVDLYPLLARLEGRSLMKVSAAPAPAPAPKRNGFKRGDAPTLKTLIGELLEVYPEARPVIERHYGSSCFTCPGQATETVEQTAGMHGMPPQKILDEINAIIKNSI